MPVYLLTIWQPAFGCCGIFATVDGAKAFAACDAERLRTSLQPDGWQSGPPYGQRSWQWTADDRLAYEIIPTEVRP